MANPNWVKGVSGNPAGSNKTAFKQDFDNLKAKKEMFDRGTQILNEKWDDIFYAMCQHAINGNVQAANFVANYILGKPKETIVHDISDDNAKTSIHINITKSESNL